MEKENMNLTEADWQVMECLWEFSPVTGREATDKLGEKMGWNRSTTLTLLRRLEAKGAVKSGSNGSKKIYEPALRREDAAMRETEDLISRVYKGSVSMLVSAFTKKQSLSKEEIEEMYALLRGLEETDDH